MSFVEFEPVLAILLYTVAGIIALVVLLSGVFQGALGFGYAIMALTTLPLILDPKAAHVVISLSGIPVMAMAAWTTREGADWSTIRGALIGAAVSLPIGLFLFDWMSDDWLIRGTGIAILVLMLTELFKKPGAAKANHWVNSSWLAGAVSGLLAGAVSIGGPPIVAYALKQNWEPIRTKAFITRCLLVIAGYKGVILFGTGYVTPRIGGQATWAAVFAIVGVYLGARWSRGMKTEAYRKIVAIVLVVISCWWIWHGAGE